ncbi:hypothetical protein [Empedobacter tilapiae]|uniref:hypothetical protein n=1 Tax=Empedobacter tilapiae TaxID=2491114 RepID=UPI0028D34C1C|nr:hypothetical protein [Empedobacter tilapiae]
MAIQKTTLQDSRGYTNKSKVVTALEFIVRDSVTKELGYADDVLPAFTETMKKATDAEKEAFRLANRKTNETYSYNLARIDAVLPTVIDIKNDYKLNITLIGLNLYKNSETTSLSIYRHLDENGQIVTPVYENVGEFEVSLTNPKILSFSKNFNGYAKGTYRIVIHDQILGDSVSGDIIVTDNISGLPEPILNYTKVITPNPSDESGIVSLSNASINLSKTPVAQTQYTVSVSSDEFLITKEEINRGCMIMFDVMLRSDYLNRNSKITFMDSNPNTNLFEVNYSNSSLIFSNGSTHNNVGNINGDIKIITDRLYLIIKGNVIKMMFINLGIVESRIVDVINGLRLGGSILASHEKTSALNIAFIKKYLI